MELKLLDWITSFFKEWQVELFVFGGIPLLLIFLYIAIVGPYYFCHRVSILKLNLVKFGLSFRTMTPGLTWRSREKLERKKATVIEQLNKRDMREPPKWQPWNQLLFLFRKRT